MKRALCVVAVCASLAAACSDPTEGSRAVSIRNDTSNAVVIRVCDSASCNNLNDRLNAGAETAENVSTAENPYEFLIVDSHGHRLGCLEVATRPVPQTPVAVSTMSACRTDRA